MWSLTEATISNGYRFAVNENGEAVSFREALVLLRDNRDFRGFLIASLQAVAFESYRWETPGYTQNSLDKMFEFVVLNAPSLNRIADSTAFDAYIGRSAKPVACFHNLGKDAYIIAPSCLKSAADYCHLGSFTRTAPISQQHALWSTVGRVGIELASTAPVWLSTAGDGVAWLHVRFDSRPKYYHYVEFKKPPER